MGVVRSIQSSQAGPTAPTVWWVSGFQVLQQQQQQGQNVRQSLEHPTAIYESGKIRKIFLLIPLQISLCTRTMHLCLSIIGVIAPRLAPHWSLSLVMEIMPGGLSRLTAIIPPNLMITARTPPYPDIRGHWHHHGHQITWSAMFWSLSWVVTTVGAY